MLLTATWVLPINRAPIENGAVIVRESKIVDVGDFHDLAARYPDEEVLDFHKAIILPGFIDMHTHLEYSVFRGAIDDLGYADWKTQLAFKSVALDEDDWESSAHIGALEAVQSGITTIADITSNGASMRAAKDAGIRGIIYYEVQGMDHTKVPQIMKKTEQEIARWTELTRGTSLKVGIAPHSPYTVSGPLYKQVTRWARENNLKLCTHLAGSKEEYDFVKYGSGRLSTGYWETMGWGDVLWQPTGVSPVKYLEEWGVFNGGDIVAVHCVQVDDYDIDTLKRYDVAIAHCPRCNAKLSMGIAPLHSFIERGLRVGIGTDSPASNNTTDPFDEMRIGLLMQRGITKSSEFTAEEFVYMATLGGAKALNLGNEIGSLEIGKEADIIVVDMSHSHQIPTREPYSALVYTANQENVKFNMVAGNILYQDFKYKTLDEVEILKRAEPIRRKVKIEG
jgi:5-methylthioadenosine/S-adenosylhomocysteine deaminase